MNECRVPVAKPGEEFRRRDGLDDAARNDMLNVAHRLPPGHQFEKDHWPECGIVPFTFSEHRHAVGHHAAEGEVRTFDVAESPGGGAFVNARAMTRAARNTEYAVGPMTRGYVTLWGDCVYVEAFFKVRTAFGRRLQAEGS